MLDAVQFLQVHQHSLSRLFQRSIISLKSRGGEWEVRVTDYTVHRCHSYRW